MQTLEAKLKFYGLSEEEHKLACGIVGSSELTNIHWALFSSLWSEHCSYKSSKVHLKNLYSDSPRLVSEEGENAGVVDLGQGEKVAFKMESHNHPSFIEPFQGAATGVGGILRDIFAMGARPIALANYLCFGEKGSDRLETLVEGVVSGISHYGNCVGVPTVTGQTEFHGSYNNNNLVNAFALGYYPPGSKIVSAKIKTPGFSVIYAGAKTGKDGVHGASMASESFGEDSEAKRPTIQIGDPFFEKCLIEACLEVMEKGLVEAVQDMGAAGLTSSSFEMASSGGRGMDIDLSKVPLRDSSLGPEEILLSESQERMLLVADPSKATAIKEVFSRWGLEATEIGSVRSEKEIRLFWRGDIICEIDPSAITEGAPRYDRPYSALDFSSSLEDVVSTDVLTATRSLQGCSRNWIYDQYDQRVGARTQTDCSSPLGIVRLPESGRELGIVLGCRPTLMRVHPEVGGADSVLSPFLQLQIKGFTPWAVTDCLNFGNPQKPHIMSEFVGSLKAMSKACEVFKAPIISGNVSLYNETQDVNITSTPSTGVVGLKESLEFKTPYSQFQNSGSHIYLLNCDQFSWSGYGGELQDSKNWLEGSIEPSEVFEFGNKVSELVKSGKIASTRLVGKFGLQYALSKMITGSTGFKAEISEPPEFWEKESFYRVLVESTETLAFEGAVLLGNTNDRATLDLHYQSWNHEQINAASFEGWRMNLEGLE